MKTFFVNLAGCVVKIQLANDITISDRLKPFLFKETPPTVDVMLDVHDCEQLPKLEPGGYWEGTNYYLYVDKELRIFHVNEVGLPPFSVTCYQEEGNVLLLYLKEYEHYFTGSSGIFNRIVAEQLLLQQNRLLLHASFVEYKGQGILFSGPSGIGKSTQAELWRQNMGAEIINGDRVAVGMTDTSWTAWGIPYAGTSGIYCNKSTPISAIVVLGQAKENQINRLDLKESFRFLYPETTIHQQDERFVQKVVALLTDLISQVPVFRLECLPDESAVEMLRKKIESYAPPSD